MEKARNFLKNNWLFCLIAAQPVLDVLAFFTRNSAVTPAGIIRLVIVFVLPVWLFFTMEDKKRLVIPLSVIALYCAAHIINLFRIGYISFTADTRYLISVVQMPVLALCFLLVIRDGRMRDQALQGAFAAAALYALFLFLSVITDSYTFTYYLTDIGVSGWIISSNCCANSIILISLCCFAMYYAISTDKKLLSWLVPPLAVFLLVLNGTQACYLTAFGLPAAYLAYFLLEPLFRGTKLRWKPIVLFCAILAVMAATVSYAPNTRNDKAESLAASKHQIRARLELERTGRKTEETDQTETEQEKVYKIYRMCLNYNAAALLRDFGYDRVMEKYNYSTDTDYLSDSRRMKRVYAALSFEDCDTATKLLGFETTWMYKEDDILDLENDWHAIFYYYGYIGFALYAAFLLYFVFLIARALLRDLRANYTPLNFTLLLTLALQLGLAHFSGQILRRPNVSIYLSIILALIYYQTVTAVKNREGAEHEA